MTTFNQKEYNRTWNRLLNLLLAVAESLNITVTYHDKLGNLAGALRYRINQGTIVQGSVSIPIRNDWKNYPILLAHELGHYLAIKKYNDNTEQRADGQALILCKALLTNKEEQVLKTLLETNFKKE